MQKYATMSETLNNRILDCATMLTNV